MSKAAWIQQNLKPGEKYAGILLGKDGAPDEHLILLPGKCSNFNWVNAMAWAASVGGELPTRREQALLFANLKEEFEPRWHWSCEQYAANASFAWSQYFGRGSQSNSHNTVEGCGQAVRRLVIF